MVHIRYKKIDNMLLIRTVSKICEAGSMIKPEDYETLAETVLYLKNNFDIAKNLGRRHVEENLSIDKKGKMTTTFNKVFIY
jgi:hypothetical protein